MAIEKWIFQNQKILVLISFVLRYTQAVIDMAQTTHKYTNGEVTIVWNPDICMHSAKCFRGLPSVFDPRKRPWVDASQSDSQAIIEQVKKCPSGALSFFMNEDGSTE